MMSSRGRRWDRIHLPVGERDLGWGPGPQPSVSAVSLSPSCAASLVVCALAGLARVEAEEPGLLGLVALRLPVVLALERGQERFALGAVV